MKKTIVTLLTLVMAFLLAACARPATTAPAETTAAVPAQTAAETKAPEATEAAEEQIPEFSVTVCGVKVGNAELASCKVAEASSESTNSEGTKKTASYAGYRMSDVFAAAGVKEIPAEVTLTATDGYSFTYAGDLSADTCLLAITKDGKSFKEGPWFAPCASEVSGDYLKNLSAIEAAGQEKKEEKKEEEAELTELAAPDVQDKTGKIEFTPFSFKVNGQDVTNAELERLSVYKAKVTVKNSKGHISEQTYSGYVLKDVLEKLGLSGAKTVKVIASDGYESEVSAEDLSSEITLIAIEKDKAAAEDGSVWLAPCSETTSGKYAKGVIEIKAE
ncbi:MAG: hypothetical protein MJ063_00375 [Lachnospiraceae bacterium]|nr:hypothetical protein [Lachnospiraceae bacterium]